MMIPLTFDRFVNMLTQSKNCGYIPSPDKVRSFCEYSMTAANAAADEDEWYSAISQKADSWLNESPKHMARMEYRKCGGGLDRRML